MCKCCIKCKQCKAQKAHHSHNTSNTNVANKPQTILGKLESKQQTLQTLSAYNEKLKTNLNADQTHLEIF